MPALKHEKKILRAWTLLQLRERRHIFPWLTEADICKLVGVCGISEPHTVPSGLMDRINYSSIRVCPNCGCRASLGCQWCFSPMRREWHYGVPIETRVAIMRSAQRANIMPSWLTDVALAELYTIDRRRVSALSFSGPLCPKCATPNPPICYACYIRDHFSKKNSDANQVCL